MQRFMCTRFVLCLAISFSGGAVSHVRPANLDGVLQTSARGWRATCHHVVDSDMLRGRYARGGLLEVQWPQQPMSRCLTPSGACWIPGYAPIGTACWCASPYGPVPGRIG